MLQQTLTKDRARSTLGGLCRPADLGSVHRRRPCGVGPAVRASGRAARHARRLGVPRRHRPAEAVAPRRARRRRAECDPGAAHRLAHGRGAGTGSRRRLFRDAVRAGVPGRQFHPHARAARLSRSAGLLPRHVRPYSDARPPRLCRDGPACRRAWACGDRRRRRPRAARLYWHSVEFGLAKEHGELKILGAGLASSFGEAHFSLESDEVERLPFSVGRAVHTPYRHDAFQPRYLVSESLEATIGAVLELTPERLLAL